MTITRVTTKSFIVNHITPLDVAESRAPKPLMRSALLTDYPQPLLLDRSTWETLWDQIANLDVQSL